MTSVEEIRVHLNGAVSKLPVSALAQAEYDLSEVVGIAYGAAHGSNDPLLLEAISQAQQAQQQTQVALQLCKACDEGITTYLARI